jgi:release factor glutamine methyltransferase
MATDVSAGALAVARRNAIRHGVDDRIAFVQTDLMPAVQQVHLVVSNPPYVPTADSESLAPEVRDHEPPLALFGGQDGLSVFRKLLPEAKSRANDAGGGRLIVEVGYDQHVAVIALAGAAGWTLERARQDLQGITRTLVFRCE